MRGKACILLILLSLAAATLPSASASGVEVEGERFSTRLTLNDQTYRLIGHGLFRYMIWDAYAGAYYQLEGRPRPAPLSAVPRRLELAYFHAIEAADFAEVTRDTLQQQLPAPAFRALQPALDDFNARYRSVRPGDRYALTWTGSSLTLALNGRTLYERPEPALAEALFGIWLGPEPLGEAFRDALLGR